MMKDYLADIEAIHKPTSNIRKTRRYYVRAVGATEARRTAQLIAEGDSGLKDPRCVHLFVRDANGEYRQLF